jgi:hypothetical protein
MTKQMEADKGPLGSTRRSFMKRSVVAAVAAGNLTVFSGLVNASSAGGSSEYYFERRQRLFLKCGPRYHRDGTFDENGEFTPNGKLVCSIGQCPPDSHEFRCGGDIDEDAPLNDPNIDPFAEVPVTIPCGESAVCYAKAGENFEPNEYPGADDPLFDPFGPEWQEIPHPEPPE